VARDDDARRSAARNARTAVALAVVVCAMVGLSYASVPLYRLFCEVTGYGGTTQVAAAAPETVSERRITVRFNTDLSPDLPWRFQPPEHAVTLRVGEPGLAVFRAVNLADRPITGTATFNVTPLKAGQYFDKTQCFCFDEQRLEAGQTADMGVSFFIDPAILDDRNLDDVTTVTLSYTFFRSLEDEPEARSPEPAAVVARPLAAALGRPAAGSGGGSVF
jgi:cytochrome c oxidase assembly protein subunit 11